MSRFAQLTLSDFLDALASSEPTPGGGTAAAVAGATGASLLMMVSGLKKSRTGADAERAALAETRAELVGIRDRILALADEDASAFDSVMAAYRLGKATDQEKAARTAAIQKAMQSATTAPLDTLRAVVDAMARARVVAAHGNPSAASDVRVALELLEAAAAGAAANIEINLAGIDGDRFKKSVADDVLTLTNRVTEHAAAARAALH